MRAEVKRESDGLVLVEGLLMEECKGWATGFGVLGLGTKGRKRNGERGLVPGRGAAALGCTSGGVLERCPNTKIGCLPLAERFAWRHARTQNPKRGARDHAHAPAPDCRRSWGRRNCPPTLFFRVMMSRGHGRRGCLTDSTRAARAAAIVVGAAALRFVSSTMQRLEELAAMAPTRIRTGC